MVDLLVTASHSASRDASHCILGPSEVVHAEAGCLDGFRRHCGLRS